MKQLRAPFLVSVVSLGAGLVGCGQSAHPAAAVCPESAPAVGAPCDEGLRCEYGSDDPCPADEYRCVNGQFEQMPRPTCNPPEPPPPPPPPPTEPTPPTNPPPLPPGNPPGPGLRAVGSKA